METIIGIFDAQYVDHALELLYEYGFDPSQLSLVENNRIIEGPTFDELAQSVEGTNASSLDAAIRAARLKSSRSVMPAITQAMNFYRESIANGAMLLIVQANAEDANEARKILRKARAANVDGPFAGV